MRGQRALAILQNVVSPGSSQASVDKSVKRLNVLESQMAGSLAPAQIYPTYQFLVAESFLFNGAIYTNYTRTIATGQPFNVAWRCAAADENDLDEKSISFPLAAGEYAFRMYWISHNGGGIFDVYFDGVKISTSTTDTYTSSTTSNQSTTFNFTCTSDGNHTLMLKVNGKHASSADYSIYFTCVMIMPQA
jgi:hypothetical protein